MKIIILDANENLLKEVVTNSNEKMGLVLEKNNIDILHLCGGKAKCTTCRIEYLEGNPERYTMAEAEKIQGIVKTKGEEDKEMLNNNVRLSCQCLIGNSDAKIKVLKRVSTSGRKNAGKPLTPDIIPSPEWKEGVFSR